MDYKKAQAEVIVTVLIILLVLGIIGVVGVMVNKTVKKGTQEAETRSNCINIKADIEEVNAINGIVKVTRGTGGSEEEKITFKVLINGVSAEATTDPVDGVGELETATLTILTEITAGAEVSVAPVLGDGTVCDVASTSTA